MTIQLSGRRNLKQLGAEDCDLCSELAGKLCQFSQLYHDSLPTRVLATTPAFTVVPTIGQIIEGYLLVLANRHSTSVAALADEDLCDLSATMEAIRQAVSDAYGVPTVFFEHGTACGTGETSGGCGIYHTHLHAVPLASEIDLLSRASHELEFKRIESLASIRVLNPTPASYLLYVDQCRNMFVAAPEWLPSQYMRRLLAEELRCAEWDWREFGVEQRLISTFHTMRQRLRSASHCEVGLPHSG